MHQIREGGDIGTVSFEKAMQWFSNQWPIDLEWPSDVPRPEPITLLEAAE